VSHEIQDSVLHYCDETETILFSRFMTVQSNPETAENAVKHCTAMNKDGYGQRDDRRTDVRHYVVCSVRSVTCMIALTLN